MWATSYLCCLRCLIQCLLLRLSVELLAGVIVLANVMHDCAQDLVLGRRSMIIVSFKNRGPLIERTIRVCNVTASTRMNV
jgi:1,4-dihydroxy-2-naphthoate octaprenyltransferase